jgi:hypothetical protein
MKKLILLAVLAIGCQHKVCDMEKRERLIFECLDRTPKNLGSAGEDLNLGSAVWPCTNMAEELSCWFEDDKMWWSK